MAKQRKLGRKTDLRMAVLKGLVTALLENGRIETTEARAKEVKNIAEKLITMAAKESDNTETKEVKVSQVKKDAKGNKVTVSKTSKNGNTYSVVEREVITKEVKVDMPSRLHARRQAFKWVYKKVDKNNTPIVDKLFDEIGPKYKERNGGYTRIYKLGQRRGDAAEVVILELV